MQKSTSFWRRACSWAVPWWSTTRRRYVYTAMAMRMLLFSTQSLREGGAHRGQHSPGPGPTLAPGPRDADVSAGTGFSNAPTARSRCHQLGRLSAAPRSPAKANAEGRRLLVTTQPPGFAVTPPPAHLTGRAQPCTREALGTETAVLPPARTVGNKVPECPQVSGPQRGTRRRPFPPAGRRATPSPGCAAPGSAPRR